MKPAFRCRNCGRLESAVAAGECAVPHACSCCGAGVVRDATVDLELCDHTLDLSRRAELLSKRAIAKRLVPGNWEILANATPERLRELGLTEVSRHERQLLHAGMRREPVDIDIHVAETMGVRDKA